MHQIHQTLEQKKIEDEKRKRMREMYTHDEIRDYSTDVLGRWINGQSIQPLNLEPPSPPSPPPKKVTFDLSLNESEISRHTLPEQLLNVQVPSRGQPVTTTHEQPVVRGATIISEPLKSGKSKGKISKYFHNFESPIGPGTFDKTALGTPRSTNKSEEYCRDIMEFIFGKSCPSVRPKWLTSPATGRRLEIDGLISGGVTLRGTFGKKGIKNSLSSVKGLKKISFGFEYDGVQHAQYKKGFHSSEEEYLYQVKKDRWKDSKLKSRGVILLRIPHVISRNMICHYIIRRMRELGLEGYAEKLREYTQIDM